MKILVASTLDPDALNSLRAQHDVVSEVRPGPTRLHELLPDQEAVILRSGVQLDREALKRAPHLRLVIRAGSGLDNIDQDYLFEHGIRLERIPGPAARSVAEMSFGLMLAVYRRIAEADRSMRRAEWRKSQLFGRTLDEKTLGIVGLGNIGRRVAELGVAWGMNVIGCVERPSPSVSARLAKGKVELLAFPDVLARADVVSIHVPLQESTRGLIGEKELAMMKTDAVLIHMARGGVVDEAALLDALLTKRLAGAGVDVHVREGEGLRSPLADLENVVLTPHLGSTTVDTQRAIGKEVLRIVDGFCTDLESRSRRPGIRVPA